MPIGEKLGQKGISAARAESISAARFLPGGEKRANTGWRGGDSKVPVMRGNFDRWGTLTHFFHFSTSSKM